MDEQSPFKWRHFEADSILLCVRWYLRYSLSYRDLEEMMLEQGVKVDHSTIYRWVLAYAPALEKRVKPQLKLTTDSWRVDETYPKVKGQWLYQYRAVDSAGNTLDFRLTPTPKGLFQKTLGAPPTLAPPVINLHKNPPYPKARENLETLAHLAPGW